MKSIVFHAANSISVEERPVPRVGERDALVRVHACGICGTDIHILHGEYIVKFPVIPGHEFSGEIVEIGSEVTNVSVGDRVTIDPNIVDHTCHFCRRGQIHLCENLSAVGVNFDGGFAEYCVVPAVQAYKVPDSVSLDEAAMTEPLACCIHGIDRAGIRPGDTMVVLGAGAIGNMLMQLARNAGAACVIVSEPHENKRELAKKMGADVAIDPSTEDVASVIAELTRVGADVVVESAGRVETAELAPKLARRGGTILQFGVVSPDKRASLLPYDIFYKELTIVGSFVNPYTHARAIQALAERQVDVQPLISHRFTLDEFPEAIRVAQTQDAEKVLVVRGTANRCAVPDESVI